MKGMINDYITNYSRLDSKLLRGPRLKPFIRTLVDFLGEQITWLGMMYRRIGINKSKYFYIYVRVRRHKTG